MAPGTLVARCPAKVNLALRVIGGRPDGYHELEVVFQAIDLWDTLEVALDTDLTLTCATPGLPTDASNLVCRAATLLAARHGRAGRPGARFVLHKTIPIQGGLGGGSSNAAAALLLCDRLWGLGLQRSELAEAAAELGADVPFFLHGGRALGRGRGDRIETLEAPDTLWLVLGCPPFGVATAAVFADYRRELTLPRNGVSVPASSAHKLAQGNDFEAAVNDLEGVVFGVWPVLAEFKEALFEVGAAKALLSGSGSTVYGIFETREARDRAVACLGQRYSTWAILGTRSVAGGARIDPPAGTEDDARRGA